MCVQAHCGAVTSLEEEAYEEIRNFCKSLVAYFAQRELSPIFIETVTRQASEERQLVGLGHHTEIEVLPIPQERLKEARVGSYPKGMKAY